MSAFENTIATRNLILQARRANTKRGAYYTRVEFDGMHVVKQTRVMVTRTTRNCIWFEDGFRITRDSGRVGNRSERVVTYIPEQDAN